MTAPWLDAGSNTTIIAIRINNVAWCGKRVAIMSTGHPLRASTGTGRTSGEINLGGCEMGACLSLLKEFEKARQRQTVGDRLNVKRVAPILQQMRLQPSWP